MEAVTHSATSKLPTPAPSPLIAMKMHPEEIADMGMAGLPVVGRNTKRLEYSDQGTGGSRSCLRRCKCPLLAPSGMVCVCAVPGSERAHTMRASIRLPLLARGMVLRACPESCKH